MDSNIMGNFKPAYLFGNLFYSVIDMRLDSGLGAISESRLFILS